MGEEEEEEEEAGAGIKSKTRVSRRHHTTPAGGCNLNIKMKNISHHGMKDRRRSRSKSGSFRTPSVPMPTPSYPISFPPLKSTLQGMMVYFRRALSARR